MTQIFGWLLLIAGVLIVAQAFLIDPTSGVSILSREAAWRGGETLNLGALNEKTNFAIAGSALMIVGAVFARPSASKH